MLKGFTSLTLDINFSVSIALVVSFPRVQSFHGSHHSYMYGMYNSNYAPEPQFLTANSKKQKVEISTESLPCGKVRRWKVWRIWKIISDSPN